MKLQTYDLHWIDAQTQAFLDLLLDSIPAVRLLLLVNMWRPITAFKQNMSLDVIIQILINDKDLLAKFFRIAVFVLADFILRN